MVHPGAELTLLSRDSNNVTIADITRLYAFEKDDAETMRRAMNVAALPESWRQYFRDKLEKQGS
jgi:MOSC domain-containing protein YiiM